MGKLDRQFEEDRQLRDSARAILLDDIDHARKNFAPKGVADRIGGRIGDGVKDVYHTAKIHTDDNRGIIAILIGAFLIWLAREPIKEALGLSDEIYSDETAPADGLDSETAFSSSNSSEIADEEINPTPLTNPPIDGENTPFGVEQ